MSEVNPKVFKGVWIPAEIWTLDALTWMEKCLWAEISFLGTMEKPCFATNAYLAKVFKSTESSISNMISRLKHYKMIKYVGSDGRFRKMVAVVPSEKPVKIKRNPSRMSEGSHHAGVKSDSMHECNIVTSKGASIETSLSSFDQVSAECSAPLSHTASDDSDLFPPDLAADAEGGKSDDLDSRPPHSLKSETSADRRKSPPKKSRQPKLVDDDFLAELALLNPGIDMDAEVRKMRSWLLANPGRQFTRAFAVTWVNKTKPTKKTTPILPNGEPDWEKWRPNE